MIQILLEVESTCSSPTLSYILDILKKSFTIIQILGPIVLLIGLTIHFIMIIINPENQEQTKKIKNTILAAVLLFLIPTIIDYSMNILGTSYTLSACWNSRKEISGGTTGSSSKKENRKKIIYSNDDYETPDPTPSEDIPTPGPSKTPGPSSSPTPTATPPSSPSPSQKDPNQTPSPSSEKEILPTEGSGKYFPALKGSNYKISGASETGGCSNSKVRHDANISVGNKVYAAFDGTIEYIQYLCNGVLFSYGNQARLTDSSTGTYVLYGHLSKFIGVDNMVTKTCHKEYGKNANCGAGACPSGIKKNKLLTKQVKKGELIGYTGNTGNSDGPHLHVEIHENGSKSCLEDPYKAMGMH